jgi:hypothetical protein
LGRNKWRVRRGLSGLLADCGIPGAFISFWIAEKLNRCDGPVCFLIPEKGISAALS